MVDYVLLTKTMNKALAELIDISGVKAGDIIVVGCSTSEVAGQRIGTGSNRAIAESLMRGILPLIKEDSLSLAIQCCEHLNRALIVENSCAKQYNFEIVSVYPKSKAGGAMGEAAMDLFDEAVVVSSIKANAGLDIGDTLIGMHLKEVAVPVRLSVNRIGHANLTAAYTRFKLIGGIRAVYEKL
ncbi:MAG TPA: TIGR01440 family protein [Thermoclostridium sp.]|nr:TIGR01440 family protein [Thermoclostridium sp.]